MAKRASLSVPRRPPLRAAGLRARARAFGRRRHLKQPVPQRLILGSPHWPLGGRARRHRRPRKSRLGARARHWPVRLLEQQAEPVELRPPCALVWWAALLLSRPSGGRPSDLAGVPAPQVATGTRISGPDDGDDAKARVGASPWKREGSKNAAPVAGRRGAGAFAMPERARCTGRAAAGQP